MTKNRDLKTRWSGLSIAELMFYESLGATLSAGGVGGSMLQVANRAGITYSYLHKTLMRLESSERFGRVLIDWETVKLTRDGQEALSYTRKVLAEYRLRPFQSKRFTLRIAATNRILTTMLAPHFQTFVESFKAKNGIDVDIEIFETSFEKTLDLLLTSDVELAFGAGNQSDRRRSKLVSRSLKSDLPMVLIAPRSGRHSFTKRRQNDGKKVGLDELKRADLCLIRRDSRDAFGEEISPESGFSRMIVDNYSSVIAMVRAGTAVGLVIDYGIPTDLLKFPLAESHLSQQNFAVWQRADGDPSPAAEMLWEIIVNSSKRARKRNSTKRDSGP